VVKILLLKENEYFEKEIDKIKEFLDKYTDICETNGLLDLKELSNLREFLSQEQVYLSEHIRKMATQSGVSGSTQSSKNKYNF
jgi:hypothetical protein